MNNNKADDVAMVKWAEKDAASTTERLLAEEEEESPPSVVAFGSSSSCNGKAVFTDATTDGVVIAEFDVDHEYVRKMTWIPFFWWLAYAFSLIFFAWDIIGAVQYSQLTLAVFLTFYVGHAMNRQAKAVESMHVAVTREGIRTDANRYPMGAFFRTTSIMPFEEIKSVKVQFGGWSTSFFCCSSKSRKTRNVVVQSIHDNTTVAVQGLKDPHAFVELVNVMVAKARANEKANSEDPEKAIGE